MCHEAKSIREFITVDASTIALTHVRVVDGTGAQGGPDQTLVIRNGLIADVGGTGTISLPSESRVLDLQGRTVLPGYVMLHEHLSFTPDGNDEVSVRFSFPRLYLAGGATTIRTAGSAGLRDDVALKRAIDQKQVPGPHSMSRRRILTSSRIGWPFQSRHSRGRMRAKAWADRGADVVQSVRPDDAR
jgi:enamidase